MKEADVKARAYGLGKVAYDYLQTTMSKNRAATERAPAGGKLRALITGVALPVDAGWTAH